MNQRTADIMKRICLAVLGLALAFYVQPARVWAIQEAYGRWTMRGESRKGG